MKKKYCKYICDGCDKECKGYSIFVPMGDGVENPGFELCFCEKCFKSFKAFVEKPT